MDGWADGGGGGGAEERVERGGESMNDHLKALQKDTISK